MLYRIVEVPDWVLILKTKCRQRCGITPDTRIDKNPGRTRKTYSGHDKICRPHTSSGGGKVPERNEVIRGINTSVFNHSSRSINADYDVSLQIERRAKLSPCGYAIAIIYR